ncbi:putative glycosyl hydrolase family 53, glycoside hydrolase superfamily [Plasmopara halstedii]
MVLLKNEVHTGAFHGNLLCSFSSFHRGSMVFQATLVFGFISIVTKLDPVAALTKGHDLSSVGLMETTKGANWISTDGTTTTIESILGAGGMEAVRLRLWTSGDYNLNYTLAMAERFSKNYKIYLDMHFSDNWADPLKQATPKGWDQSSVSALSADLRAYVKSTLMAFTDRGIQLEILSLGNEVTNGFLFPTGKVTNSDFQNFATLWKAAREGVADAVAAGTHQPLVMIHLDNGWKYETMSWFLKGFFAVGTVTEKDVDAFGFSYYPFFDEKATIDALSSSLTQLANTYKKPIYIAETDWPTECKTVTLSAPYPISDKGQLEGGYFLLGTCLP